MSKGIKITDEKREAIRQMRDRFHKMPYREIGVRVGVSTATVCLTLNPRCRPSSISKPKTASARVTMALPPCTVQQPDSIIRPVPLAMLMAGNARRSIRL